jgi:uncharacterized protein
VAGPYLNWWLAGLALGGLAALQWLLERRTLGVSGFVQRSMQFFLRREAAQQEQRVITADRDELRAALLAATAEDAGEELMPLPVTTASQGTDAKPLGRLITSRGALMYVIGIAVGGAVAALQRGTFGASTLGPRFEELWGDGLLAVLALFGGGVLVGIGTRMAGGCTSGHGLSGCSRFQVGSLVSTCIFMAAAVAMTFVLRRGG